MVSRFPVVVMFGGKKLTLTLSTPFCTLWFCFRTQTNLIFTNCYPYKWTTCNCFNCTRYVKILFKIYKYHKKAVHWDLTVKEKIILKISFPIQNISGKSDKTLLSLLLFCKTFHIDIYQQIHTKALWSFAVSMECREEFLNWKFFLLKFPLRTFTHLLYNIFFSGM